MTETLDGRVVSAGIRGRVTEVASLLRHRGITPTLAVVVATDEEASHAYVRAITRAAQACGIEAHVCDVGRSATSAGVSATVRDLAADDGVHGIIVQTPLPQGIVPAEVTSFLPVDKDVDGAGVLSVGRLFRGLPAFAPATAQAVMEILGHYSVPLRGANAVVIGRSEVVGRPAAELLLRADATVTVCHSKTVDLAAVARGADVLVVAIGRPRFVGRIFVKPGAVVIDVGTNFDVDGSMMGDVDAVAVDGVAGGLTPVPGGVGPVTTAVLLRNTLAAAAGLQAG
ncbi:MAG: Methylenetetrahydrofolate dehydrogenase [Streptosporangiaceae bacterium]|nr:Methylenetetrahydrofolate dehydrogenase [Streptosporangiaceae bacterium]